MAKSDWDVPLRNDAGSCLADVGVSYLPFQSGTDPEIPGVVGLENGVGGGREEAEGEGMGGEVAGVGVVVGVGVRGWVGWWGGGGRAVLVFSF